MHLGQMASSKKEERSYSDVAFAVAPTEVTSLADLAFLDARLGFDRGAVLSGFPKAWFRDVSNQLRRAYQGNTLDRATERLRAFKENKTVAFNPAFKLVRDVWSSHS